MNNSLGIKSGITYRALAVLATTFVIVASLIPAMANSGGQGLSHDIGPLATDTGTYTVTYTPSPPPFRVWIRDTWMGVYGWNGTDEVVEDSEYDVGEHVLIEVGWTTFISGKKTVIINLVDEDGLTTPYGGQPWILDFVNYSVAVVHGIWFDQGSKELYMAGYVQEQKDSPMLGLVMKVHPYTKTIDWVRVFSVGQNTEAMDITYVWNGSALAVVGHYFTYGENGDAFLLKVDPADGHVLNAYSIGLDDYDETATAVATDGRHQFLTVNVVKPDQNSPRLVPTIMMTDWDSLISVASIINQSGRLEDIEWWVNPGNGFSEVYAVGGSAGGGPNAGLVVSLRVTPAGFTPNFARVERLVGANGEYQELSYNGVTLNAERARAVIAGEAFSVSNGLNEAFVRLMDPVTHVGPAYVAKNYAHTSAVEAFINKDNEQLEYVWFAGTSAGMFPAATPYDKNMVAGRIRLGLVPPISLEWYICGGLPQGMYDAGRVVPTDLRVIYDQSRIRKAQFWDTPTTATSKEPKVLQCLEYGYFSLIVTVTHISTTITFTTTETTTETTTVTTTESSTTSTTFTVTSISVITATLKEYGNITTTLTTTLTRTATSTVTVVATDERTTYSVLGVGAVLGALILACVFRRH